MQHLNLQTTTHLLTEIRDICLRFTELNCVDLEVTYPSPQRQVLNSLLINMYKYYGLSTIFFMH